mgnify:CR=1 FL=1
MLMTHDAAILADSVEDMQEMVNCLIKAAAAAGLILSAPKTKILRSPDA